MKYAAYFAGVVAVLLAVGCGAKSGDEGAAGETAEMTAEDVPETWVSPTGTRTVKSGAAVVLPDDFPKDVPRYEGMELKWVEEDAVANTVGFSATTFDPQATVVEFYKKQLEANGWSVARKFEIGEGSTTLVYSKGARALRLGIMCTSQPTIIMLWVTKE